MLAHGQRLQLQRHVLITEMQLWRRGDSRPLPLPGRGFVDGVARAPDADAGCGAFLRLSWSPSDDGFATCARDKKRTKTTLQQKHARNSGNDTRRERTCGCVVQPLAVFRSVFADMVLERVCPEHWASRG